MNRGRSLRKYSKKLTGGFGGSAGTSVNVGAGGLPANVSDVTISAIGNLGIWGFTAGQSGGPGGAIAGAVGGSVTWGATQGSIISGGAGSGSIPSGNTNFAGGSIASGGGNTPVISGGIAGGGDGLSGFVSLQPFFSLGGAGGGSNNAVTVVGVATD